MKTVEEINNNVKDEFLKENAKHSLYQDNQSLLKIQQLKLRLKILPQLVGFLEDHNKHN